MFNVLGKIGIEFGPVIETITETRLKPDGELIGGCDAFARIATN